MMPVLPTVHGPQEVHSTQSDPLLGQRLLVQDKWAASLRGPRAVEATRAVKASDSARYLWSAQHTVRPTARAETVGVLQKGGLAKRGPSARSLGSAQHTVRPTVRAETVGVVQKGGLAERAPVKKRQGDASASDSARSIRSAQHTVRPTLRAETECAGQEGGLPERAQDRGGHESRGGLGRCTVPRECTTYSPSRF